MTINQGSYNAIIEKIANVYKFDVYYCEIQKKWFVRATGKEGTEFYWDSNQTEQDFFDELESFFYCEGKESVVTY